MPETFSTTGSTAVGRKVDGNINLIRSSDLEFNAIISCKCLVEFLFQNKRNKKNRADVQWVCDDGDVCNTLQNIKSLLAWTMIITITRPASSSPHHRTRLITDSSASNYSRCLVAASGAV